MSVKCFVFVGLFFSATVKGSSINRLHNRVVDDLVGSLEAHGGGSRGGSARAAALTSSEPDELVITYRIAHYSIDQSQDVIDAAVSEGFGIWERRYVKEYLQQNGCSDLHFRQTMSENADLTVTFSHELFLKEYSHLANFESIYSPTRKTIYVNDRYDLTPDTITPVIAHEIGHYFKLKHTYDRGDIMNPKERNLWLSDTDLWQLRLRLQCTTY